MMSQMEISNVFFFRVRSMFEGTDTRKAEYSFHDMIREQKMKVASLNFPQSLFYIKLHATPTDICS